MIERRGQVLKIKYPDGIEEKYYKFIVENIFKNNTALINKELKDHTKKLKDKENPLKFLLTSSFRELLDIAKDNPTKDFEEDIKYDGPEVHKFFHKYIKDQITSCFYCNIDYINVVSIKEATNLSAKFSDKIDFLNNADEESLIKASLSESVTKKIIDARINHTYQGIDELKNTDIIKWHHTQSVDDIINVIRKFDLNSCFGENKDHFVLDHVLPKGEYPILALSLYNFVPCCHNCNSRFKHTKEFTVCEELSNVIPSSNDYRFAQDYQFKVFIDSDNDIADETIESPLKKKGVKEVIDEALGAKGRDIIKEYLRIFKIKKRYQYHEKKGLDLIEKREAYPDSNIEECVRLLGINSLQLKKDLFGKDLFEECYDNEPFVKYRRDVAKSLEIKEVK